MLQKEEPDGFATEVYMLRNNNMAIGKHVRLHFLFSVDKILSKRTKNRLTDFPIREGGGD
jgi:hypothetical protein